MSDNDAVTPREPVAADAVIAARDRYMQARHARLRAAEYGCAYCGGDTLAAQIVRLRRLVGVTIAILFVLVALRIADLLR